MLTLFFAYITLVFIFFCNAHVYKRSDNNPGNSAKEKVNDFDSFILAQFWPQTICWETNKKWESAKCNCSPCKLPDSNNSWTLHGLWPNNKQGQSPFFCNTKIFYKPNALDTDLRSQMDEKWPNYKLGVGNDEFWRYEWKKHGSCAASYNSTDNLLKYFLKALKLLQTYNAGKLLKQHKIVPGNIYELANFTIPIKRYIRVDPFIMCAQSPITGEQYISQVYICFDKLFIPIQCDRNGRITNCKWQKNIIYPKNLPLC